MMIDLFRIFTLMYATVRFYDWAIAFFGGPRKIFLSYF